MELLMLVIIALAAVGYILKQPLIGSKPALQPIKIKEEKVHKRR